MPPCRCALRDREGNVVLARTGYVKFYVTCDAPGLPSWLQSVDGKGKGAEGIIRWLNGAEGYYLCQCPECGTGTVEVAYAPQATPQAA